MNGLKITLKKKYNNYKNFNNSYIPNLWVREFSAKRESTYRDSQSGTNSKPSLFVTGLGKSHDCVSEREALNIKQTNGKWLRFLFDGLFLNVEFSLDTEPRDEVRNETAACPVKYSKTISLTSLICLLNLSPFDTIILPSLFNRAGSDVPLCEDSRSCGAV